MRIRKAPDARRQEILAGAEQLFHERGYADVQVDDIMAICQLSRGGFYHYFASKADILGALIRAETAKTVERARKDEALTLAGIIRAGSAYIHGEPGIAATLDGAGEIDLYLRFLEDAHQELLAQLIRDLIAAGVASGAYADVPAAHVAELFLAINTHINRKTLLGAWSDTEAAAFSRTALGALGALLGAEAEFAALTQSLTAE